MLNKSIISQLFEIRNKHFAWRVLFLDSLINMELKFKSGPYFMVIN